MSDDRLIWRLAVIVAAVAAVSSDLGDAVVLITVVVLVTAGALLIMLRLLAPHEPEPCSFCDQPKTDHDQRCPIAARRP